MADVLTAKQGDTLDELIWRERSLGAADIGRVLRLNPGIADLGAVLPLGTTVAMPVSMAPAPRTLPLIQLWD
jgi:phage tail protein X